MRTTLRTILALAAFLPSVGAAAGFEPATRADLLLSARAAKPGETIQAGVRLRSKSGWHTYWRNGGESGKATEIQWTLPPGITTGPIQWPPPEKYVAEGITTYVYHDEVVLTIPLAIATGTPSGEYTIAARVSWLECEVNCVPGEASVSAKLSVGSESVPSPESSLLQQWAGRVPTPNPRLEARAWWEGPPAGNQRNLILDWKPTAPAVQAEFFPYENDLVEIAGRTDPVAIAEGRLGLRKQVTRIGERWPGEISGLAAELKEGKLVAAYEIKLVPAESRPADGSPSVGAAPQPAPVPSQESTRRASFLTMFLLAFLGGLILNVMPCVLPVIALKILGFVNQSREEPGRVKKLGLVYALGVLASFAVLAGMVVAVQLAGRSASWGMQFGNPVFVVLLTILITLVALNLFGVFEVSLGSRTMSAAAQAAGREGTAGAFLNGVLATALATPCTAPFLGLALGLAFTQPPAIIILVFLTVGAGLAFPYVLLSWNPAWLKVLPKPGPWMERFKVAMGFPMLATAVWLCSVAQAHYGKRTLWLGLFLVVLALCAWIYGAFVQRAERRRQLAWAALLLLLVSGYGYALEHQLRWRNPPPLETAEEGTLRANDQGIAWQPWSKAAVDHARAAGRPVFVDFTADWCLTCQANKKTSIEIPSVRERLKAINAVALLGDYTRTPPAITEELRRFGRAGVPLVVVYPRDTNAPPIVLPELLTPSLVLDALDKAAR